MTRESPQLSHHDPAICSSRLEVLLRFPGAGGMCYKLWAVEEALSKDVVSAADDRVKTPPEEVLRYCPVCSRPLASKHCKLVCPGCGYYMSCSDYY